MDLGLGLAFLVGGAAFFWSAQGFQPMIPDTAVGPGLLPTICAVVFMLFGGLLAAAASRRMRTGVVSAGLEDDERGSLVFGIIVLGGLVLVVLTIPYLGFVITSSLYAFAVTKAGQASWWGAALSAVLVTLGVYLLFANVMRVPLPMGILF